MERGTNMSNNMFTENEYLEYVELKTKMGILKRFYDRSDYCSSEDFYSITGYSRKAGEDK